MNSFTYTEKEELSILSKSQGGGYVKRATVISYNGQPEKVDIRTWQATPEGYKPTKSGITLTPAEEEALRQALNKRHK